MVLLSRHLSEPPCEGVELTTLDTMVSTPPDVIIGCFETDERSREFWLDQRVGQAVAERGAGCIEMSTLSLGWARDWHGAVSAAGGISVESPVTGSRPGATSGTLSAFVYESAPDPRVRRVLDCFVSKRYDFHLPGNPTCFKLVYNAWGPRCCTQLQRMCRLCRTAWAGTSMSPRRSSAATAGWLWSARAN